jgi:hypothetical protein
MFDSPATLPSVDRALHCLTEATPSSTFGLPGIHRLYQPVPHCATLPTTSNRTVGSAASCRSQRLGNTELHLITDAQPIMAFMPTLYDLPSPIINTRHMFAAVAITA